MSRTSRSVPTLALAALLAGFALTGCGDSKAGAAAVVGGDRIDISTLNSRVEKAADARESVGAAAVPGVEASQEELTLLVQTKVLDEVARREGIVVSATDIAVEKRKLLAQTGGQPIEAILAGRGVPASGVDSAVRTQTIINRLLAKHGEARANAIYIETAESLNITVNPRYGKWDLAEDALAPVDYAWLTPGKGAADPSV
ncbi:SurA N-terminal domain-containing protein [Yinghuangia sp. YIM S09857]|uniref:SurA N-terminal domain-containing protein n=1 Tax=Yinghuangia sp. YIM S09857 TaxID=3436929 RepID=UPI003F53A248